MIVGDVHHVSLNVSDVGRAVSFYCDVLGLTRLPRPDLGLGGAWLGLPGGRQIHLIESEVPPDRGQHVAFEVDDIDLAVDELRRHGVDVSGPRRVGPTAARQAFFADPDGNRLELNQPA
jgi:glyoxylase I family protein